MVRTLASERREFVEPGAEVDGAAHADLAARVDLPREQVEPQVRVHPAHLGRVVAVAVMALREDRDRVHVPDLERLLELALVEARPDARDETARVKVEVDLTEPEVMHGREGQEMRISAPASGG